MEKNVFNKDKVRLFGFEVTTRQFIATLGIGFATLLMLLVLDMYVVSISWYGVIMGTGFMLGLFFSVQLCKHRGIDPEFPYSLICWVFPFSIVGARTYYVLTSLHEFDKFSQVFAVWNGGMAIYGGIMGGIIGLIIACKIHKVKILNTMDVVVPGLIIAQALGRWGNFINQEVYGFEVTAKWLQWFPFAVNVNESWFLATFFYESVLNFLGFILLVHIIRKHKTVGIVSATYMIYYGIVRLFLEGLRIPRYILYIPNTNLPVSQVVSGVIILLGIGWLIYLLKTNKGENAKK